MCTFCVTFISRYHVVVDVPRHQPLTYKKHTQEKIQTILYLVILIVGVLQVMCKCIPPRFMQTVSVSSIGSARGAQSGTQSGAHHGSHSGAPRGSQGISLRCVVVVVIEAVGLGYVLDKLPGILRKVL